jgi:hypothetical protein
MYRDDIRHRVFDQLRQHDLRIFAHQLTPAVLLAAAQRAGLRIWACPLHLINLAWLAIACAWRHGESFVSILTVTLKLLQDQEHLAHLGGHPPKPPKKDQRPRSARTAGPPSKHHPKGSDPCRVSEEAFAKARQKMPPTFWVELLLLLGQRFEEQYRPQMRFGRFRLLAIDGTQLALPDEAALRQHFGTANNANGRQGAQARLVMLQAPLVRLPLAYQLEPLATGEVTIARQLTRHLRGDDLLLLDAGFLSYGLLWDIQRQNAFFGQRLRRKLHLKTLRRLEGRRDRLVVWTPKDSRGQWRREGLPKAITLRLIEYRVRGHRPIEILTNVLSPEQLSYQDVARLTTATEVGEGSWPGLYHLRWQIEIGYKELKVDQKLKGGLRSRTVASVGYEVAGQVVLYLLIRWLMVEAAVAHGVDPLRLSFRGALRELLGMWNSFVTSSPAWVAERLYPRLLHRIASHQVPYRPGRSYPRKKKAKRAKGKTTKNKS